MAKNYKLTYEVVFYPKLKDVSFHDRVTRPIYIKTIFKRSVKDFKSTSFDVLAQPKYKKQITDAKAVLANIVEEESELMEFISRKLDSETSPDDLLAIYKLYSTDITELLEEAFRAYMVLFFSDLKLQVLHRTIADNRSIILYESLLDFKTIIQPDISKRLFDNAIMQRQVYMPVYEFASKLNGTWTRQLTLFRWQSEKVQNQFRKFLSQNYNEKQNVIFTAMEKWAKELLGAA